MKVTRALRWTVRIRRAWASGEIGLTFTFVTMAASVVILGIANYSLSKTVRSYQGMLASCAIARSLQSASIQACLNLLRDTEVHPPEHFNSWRGGWGQDPSDRLTIPDPAIDKPCQQGMTLMPGESCTMFVPLPGVPLTEGPR